MVRPHRVHLCYTPVVVTRVALPAAGRRPLSPRSSPAAIKVEAATYGVEGRLAEVTDGAVEAFKKGEPLVAGTQTLAVADPAPFVEKELIVTATVAGKLGVTVRGREGRSVLVTLFNRRAPMPYMLTRAKPISVNGPIPMKVLGAVYGTAAQPVNVTRGVAELINSGKPVPPDPRPLGLDKDPAFGTPKTLTLWLECNGVRFVVSVMDYGLIEFRAAE